MNQVKIFNFESNLSTSKRVLLLANPKLRCCQVCSEQFLSENLLQEHLNSTHKSSKRDPLTCRVCDKTFESEFTLKAHLKWCVSYPCPHCADHKAFACSKLVEHTRSVHGDQYPFKCCKCKNEFGEYKTYVRHKCTGHVCSKCGKKFPSTVGLTHHVDKHKNVPCNVPFKTCPVCKDM